MAEGREFLVNPSVRGAVQFAQKNLVVDDPEFWGTGRFDIIFCRNVIMYFSTETAKAVIERMSRRSR